MNIRKIISTIFVIIWMFTIFCFSQQRGEGSSSTSKNVTMIIVNILDIKYKMTEDQKEETVKIIEPIIRKVAHYTLYMIGGMLIINCINTYIKKDKRIVLYSSAIGILYAVSDELHQLFVNGRSGKIEDVIIDSIGIFTGIAMYLFVKKIRERIMDKRKYKGSE